MKVHILTKGFISPNARAFLFPLIVHRGILQKEYNVQLSFFDSIKESLYGCDVLIFESKYFQTWWASNSDVVIEKIKIFKKRVRAVIYFNIGDSSTWDHARVLPYVDGYFANQLLKDRTAYLQSFYGNRIYTDYYHKKYNIIDRQPQSSEPIEDKSLLLKIGLGWNSGLADYSLLGPYRMAFYKRFPLKYILSYPQKIKKPSMNRYVDCSYRMGISYERKTVSWQRLCLKNMFENQMQSIKLSRWKYFAELMTTKVVASPFGLGEITLKDFETFLTGGLLLKPDMSHMETWPDFFLPNKTILTHNWDLTDFSEVLDYALNNYSKVIEIAKYGQNQYRRYTYSKDAPYLFCNHFLNILNLKMEKNYG